MFYLLEHPSDVGIFAQGTSPEDALIEASKGLVSILVNPENFRPLEERHFKSTGTDHAAQVVNWLNEILFFFDTEGMVFVEFAIDSWTLEGINGRALGERFDTDRHELRTAVKAATYHQFEAHSTAEGGWELRVFVDV
jgi:SHS2 domain-containing protein